jgi:Raf kinase inhibitor-like YbhB/YbcL family protein
MQTFVAQPRAALAASVVLASAACGLTSHEGGATMTLRLTSSSFEHEKDIPTRHTCEGADISPPLAWSGAPAGTQSFALIVDDPDAPDPRAPKKTWVHWVVYDIPANVSSLAEGAALPQGARDGRNDWKVTGFRGPCPPIGRHRYFHKLYALDVKLHDLTDPDKPALEAAMKGHILGEATLIGTYAKNADK